jgi:hypothetical protein
MVSAVAQYFIRVSQGAYSGGPDHAFESLDQNAAWIEMTKVCGDFIGSACRKLDPNSDWSMELLDENKQCTARIRLVAEKFG